MDDDVAVVVGDEKQIPAPIRSETTLEDELVLDAPAQKTLNLYKVDNYTFGTKQSSQKQHERNPQRLKEKYQERGLRHSVAGVLLVHHHRHPHVLVLQQTKDSGSFWLPGGRLRPGEGDLEGLSRKLDNRLRSPSQEKGSWEIGDFLATWWYPDFSDNRYPYIPPHVTKPKEKLNLFLVQLPESCAFSVPNDLQLLAIPLFQVYNNAEQYGEVISSLPILLSRYHVNYL
ncbi:hypothetical protein GAYE_SCF09G3221 [Galdieria yellowstonensis]|uniref:Cleavage and polyadenylation specificity factor subunit 5 n=1 Tax=Galdieria yellowstonensis TaxID=3028027 RepID=A0AAV9IDJ1_9RHOD|nr:hypothetical protein GAYE_SCF09G3221 [Galdieria yellowstonensis]